VNTFLAVAGALGGVAVFVTAVVTIVRSVTNQISATRDNTKALQELSGKIDQMDGTVGQHGERIARLEGRRVAP
jgi:hypothetical protein